MEGSPKRQCTGTPTSEVNLRRFTLAVERFKRRPRVNSEPAIPPLLSSPINASGPVCVPPLPDTFYLQLIFFSDGFSPYRRNPRRCVPRLYELPAIDVD